MAVQRSSSGFSGRRRGPSLLGRGGRGRFSIVLRVIFGIFLLMLFFGMMNQMALGRSLFDWIYTNGVIVGKNIEYIFTGDEKSLVDITDQGIYARGYAPEGSSEIEPEKVGVGERAQQPQEQQQEKK